MRRSKMRKPTIEIAYDASPDQWAKVLHAVTRAGQGDSLPEVMAEYRDEPYIDTKPVKTLCGSILDAMRGAQG